MQVSETIKYCGSNILKSWTQTIPSMALTYIYFNPVMAPIILTTGFCVTIVRTESKQLWSPPRDMSNGDLDRGIVIALGNSRGEETEKTEKIKPVHTAIGVWQNITRSNHRLSEEFKIQGLPIPVLKPLNIVDFFNLICDRIYPLLEFFARHGIAIKNMGYIEPVSILSIYDGEVHKFQSIKLTNISSSITENCYNELASQKVVYKVCNLIQDLCSELTIYGINAPLCPNFSIFDSAILLELHKNIPHASLRAINMTKLIYPLDISLIGCKAANIAFNDSESSNLLALGGVTEDQ